MRQYTVLHTQGPPPPPEPDDTEPTLDRQQELREACAKNREQRKAPYTGVHVQTKGELLWIMREQGWSGEQTALDSQQPNFNHAIFASANLRGVKLANAKLRNAYFAQTDLTEAELVWADLTLAYMHSAVLSGAHLERSSLRHAQLNHVTIEGASLSGADMRDAEVRSAKLHGSILALVNLAGASLSYADLSSSSLSHADLRGTDLEGANLRGASLRGVRMNEETVLTGVALDERTRVVDVVWDGAPLTRVTWEHMSKLGDEIAPGQLIKPDGKPKSKSERTGEYEEAVRANRQLATALQGQGLNEHADRFAYRAQVCQLRLLRLQRNYLRYLGSLFLGLISGYGYRPLRSFATYLLVVTLFGLAYWALGVQTGHLLTWNEAGVVSLTAFHGRGFFATAFQPGDPQAALAALEAVIGLLIEITFIATFTQRFFAR
jgi:uncharacterized protein YjbI with pentapeptide repeats